MVIAFFLCILNEKGLRDPGRGVLLFGPPDTGKTMLARAVAKNIDDAAFIPVSAFSLLDPFVGQSEMVRRSR